jgi:spoIIIJ-associated protein
VAGNEAAVRRSAEGRGVSTQDAIRQALAALGVSRDAVDVEVLAEARRGLFGGPRPAHVRVTVLGRRGAPPHADDQTPAGTPQDGAAGPIETEEEHDVENGETIEREAEAREADEQTTDEVEFDDLSAEEKLDLLDEEAELAADFVEGLLDRLDLPGDIEIEVQEEQAIVNVLDVGSGLLIGRRGATLDALQELVRGAIQRQTARRPHVRVDVEHYRSRQLEKLRDKCREAIAEVRETGKAFRLEPMDPYERKMMHDLVAKTRGVTSSSEGTEPKRRVVVHPAD